ncbi:pilus assembly protein [Solimonas fluminis]|uniref:Pilus assembly protein n=2 Tax=Solimonas fluminis TaxID=2086571 RepID=A0A2S5TJL9_9GAMM|nr:pilus assembly protein [Solimonas fluminis]
MIEVLVTLIIVSIGLLGLAQLQSKMQLSDMEAYQRAQALMLVKDMASSIAANRKAAASYVTTAPLGAGMTCPVPSAIPTRQERDRAQWCRFLQGVAERQNTTDRGAMIGARGCVTALGGDAYLVTVAWQGLLPIAAPPAGVACGAGQYNDGAACTSDRCRRVETMVVRLGTLI